MHWQIPQGKSWPCIHPCWPHLESIQQHTQSSLGVDIGGGDIDTEGYEGSGARVTADGGGDDDGPFEVGEIVSAQWQSGLEYQPAEVKARFVIEIEGSGSEAQQWQQLIALAPDAQQPVA